MTLIESNHPSMMTVSFVQQQQQRCSSEETMSLFQNLKLKRHKTRDAHESRCSSDGECVVENSSCSPDSISPTGSSSHSLEEAAYHASVDLSRISHEDQRTSPDSAGDGYGKINQLKQLEHTQIYDGGGEDEYDVSSTPMALDPQSRMDERRSYDEDMTDLQPPRPDSTDRKLDIQSTIHIAPLYAGNDEGHSLGAGGTTGGDLTASVGHIHTGHRRLHSPPPRSPPHTNILWNHINGNHKREPSLSPPNLNNFHHLPQQVPMESKASRKAGNKPKSQRNSKNNGMNGLTNMSNMFWAMAGNGPRETLDSPLRTHGHLKMEASDAFKASVDGLLALGGQDRINRISPGLLALGGQDRINRISPPQQSPSPSTMSSRSTFTPLSSPYPMDPISPTHFSTVVRVSSSASDMSSMNSSSYPYQMSPMDTNNAPVPPPRTHSPLNMEKLWARDPVEICRAHYQSNRKPDSAALDLTKSEMWNGQGSSTVDSSGVPMHGVHLEEEDTPMVCMICDDKATGLHYGIITCEGCKGFFKRTVQNKRVYNCIADQDCPVTKQQRNRCQYCRFQKCINKGMVLAAVREDRMPGGRNSGAVYNMYKVNVKYKKKKNKGSQRNNNEKSKNVRNSYSPGLMSGRNSPMEMMHTKPHGHNSPMEMMHTKPHGHNSPMEMMHSKSHGPSSPMEMIHMKSHGHNNSMEMLHTKSHGHSSPIEMLHSKSHGHNSNLEMLQPKPLTSQIQYSPHPVHSSPMNHMPSSSMPSLGSRRENIATGNILKTALTNPEEIIFFRQRENVVSSTKDMPLPLNVCNSLINDLIKLEDTNDLVMIMGVREKLEESFEEYCATMSEDDKKLTYEAKRTSVISDTIGKRLVDWVISLPFLPNGGKTALEHGGLLGSSWHDLIVLSTANYLASKLDNSHIPMGNEDHETMNETAKMIRLWKVGERFLREVDYDNDDPSIAHLISILAELTVFFRRMKLQLEEYVLLKTIIFLNTEDVDEGDMMAEKNKYQGIQEKYISCLTLFCQTQFPSQINRVKDMMAKIPVVKTAARIQHDIKAFYVPLIIAIEATR